MDRDGWLRDTTQLSTLCGASTINNQIIFFDVNGSHFEYQACSYMEYRNIPPFILKAGDPGNNQTNDNEPNEKLKSH